MIKLSFQYGNSKDEPSATLCFPDSTTLDDLVRGINFFLKLYGYAPESVDTYIDIGSDDDTILKLTKEEEEYLDLNNDEIND